MSRHRNDIGGFQPTNTLRAPSLHSIHRAPNHHHISIPLTHREKRLSSDQAAVEQPQSKRQRTTHMLQYDIEDDFVKRSLGRTWPDSFSLTRVRGTPLEHQTAGSASETKAGALASENAFASALSAPSGRAARKALTTDYFQNSEFHTVEQLMRPSPQLSPKASRKTALSHATQRGHSEVFELTPDDSTRLPKQSAVHTKKARDLSDMPHHRERVEDSSDELAEDYTSLQSSRAQRKPTLTVLSPKISSRPQETRRDLDRISLMQFQCATYTRGPGVNVSLQISKTDALARALVICPDDDTLSLSFDDFDKAFYAQPRSAALLSRDKGPWAYFRFPKVEQLSAFLATEKLSKMDQEELRPDKLQDRLLELKRRSPIADHSDSSTTLPTVVKTRTIPQIKPDKAAEAIQPQRERRVRRIKQLEDKSNLEQLDRSRPPPSSPPPSSEGHNIPPASNLRRQELDLETSLSSRFADICRRRKPWKESLIYPSTGRHRATVEWADLERLDDEEFLNDNIISFCLLHLQNTGPGLLLDNRVYFFNTFFYTALTKPVKGQRGINYPAVKTWTKKVDLFGYDYIVVPIHKDLHWYCAIICNVGQLEADSSPPKAERATSPRILSTQSSSVPLSKAKSDSRASDQHSEPIVIDLDSSKLNEKTSQLSIHDSIAGMQAETHSKSDGPVPPESPSRDKKRAKPPRSAHDTREPLIIILDSLGNSHPEVSRHLKDYLKAESLDKRNIAIDKEPKGLNAKGQPGQHNFSDCGVFLVAYLTRFVEDPARFVEAIVQRDSDFWATMEAHKLRKHYLELILQTYDWTHADEKDQKPTGKGQNQPLDEGRISDLDSSGEEDWCKYLKQRLRRSSGPSYEMPVNASEHGSHDRRGNGSTLPLEVQVLASDEANIDIKSMRAELEDKARRGLQRYMGVE